MTAGVLPSRALLLDRDGTLVRDVGYPRDPATVELLPGVAEVLRDARALGYKLAIVSNQSGVGRGLIQPSEAQAVQARVDELFREQGVSFDGTWFCFHLPDAGCECRKPAPGMLLRAAKELGVELGRSIMVGDKDSDVMAGVAAGCTAVGLGKTVHAGALATFDGWAALGAWLRAKG